MDVTDLVDYNVALLNHNDLANSFFCLSKTDPTAGFAFDPSSVAGHTYPEISTPLGKPDTQGTSPHSRRPASMLDPV
jgi:DNA polymerase iota